MNFCRKGKVRLLSPYMESRRWLLVLMLGPLLWLQMVKSGFSVQSFANVTKWTPTITIPEDGVYLISVIVDPSLRSNLTLLLYCLCQGTERYFFSAHGEAIYSHAEVATGLKKNDVLFLKKLGETIEAASSLSVVYVGELNSFYITVMNRFLWSPRSPIKYSSHLTPNGWNLLQDPMIQTTFTISITGMYWVTARAKPELDSLTMTVRIGSNDLFSAFAEKGRSVSASGAFYLQSGSNIQAVNQGGVVYEPQTLLSAVYLAGNKKPNTYPFEHIAFTAELDSLRPVVAQEVLQFKRVLTNYGYIYVDGYTEIRRTGSYMVSIRPDPESNTLVAVNLYVNGRFYWVIYAEEGVPVGATISLSLQAGSYLEVRSVKVSTLGRGTMFSIAFIQP